MNCNTGKESNSNINPTVTDNANLIVNYFLLDQNRESDKKANTKTTEQMHNEFKDFLFFSRNRLLFGYVHFADQEGS